MQELVRYIYDEATNALTSSVAAKITANGIETPLGVLTLGQIEKGEKYLMELYDQFQKKKKNRSEMERLTGEFYTAIPHRIGRTRAAVDTAVIDSLEVFEQKQNILQLMKDMLQVNGDGEGGNVLFNAQIDQEYEALGCQIEAIDAANPKFGELKEYVEKSQVKTNNVRVQNIYTLKRKGEWDAFTRKIDNQRILFHGSRIQNWVGILSRGILLPKIVVSLGVNRTDAGWLGNGIYFGDAICTSTFYATPGRRKTKLIGLTRVALMARRRNTRKSPTACRGPPDGYDSCHGVRNTSKTPSQFADDEYVVYQMEQQRLEYLVEVTS